MPRTDVKITDHSAEVKAEIEKRIALALEAMGGECERFAKENLNNYPLKHTTGALKNSIAHKVVLDDQQVVIGTNIKYGAYIELGTGIYTPGGRQTPWVYQDVKGDWHYTRGQEAKPFLKPAAADHQDRYKQIADHYLHDN